jgi:hypothetical protein
MSHRPTDVFWSYRAYAISTDMYERFRSFLCSSTFFFMAEDEEASASDVFLKGECAIMVVLGGGGATLFASHGHYNAS